MKKVIALILCGVMLLTLAVGCKKEEKTPEVLDDSRIASDLIHSRAAYAFAHMEETPSIADLKIVEKNEKNDAATVSVTAKAINPYGTVELAAKMEYERQDIRWILKNVEITKAVPTPTAAPNQESVLMEISNYISIVGKALAVKDDKSHMLEFNVRAVTWEMQCEAGAKTATLNLSYKSDALTFTGYYTLNFKETGWVIESQKQENGQYYPVLYLKTLEQKK